MEWNVCLERADLLLHFEPHDGYARLDVLRVVKDLRFGKSGSMDIPQH